INCLQGHSGGNTAHPEVLGVHVQLVAVQLGQLGEGVLDVVQVLDGFPEGGEHFLAMGADHGVARDGGGAGEVPEGREEPLGPGVDDQQPGERQRDTTLSLAPSGAGWRCWGGMQGACGPGLPRRGLDDHGARCLHWPWATGCHRFP
uniref:Uncharacterized protein n=1 Tax=Bubo bubo TaxID=30461 RepID=A0A8C0F8K8_BUBBB